MTSRATLTASIKQSIRRLPAGHYGHSRARRQLELLESDCPITPATMTNIAMAVDWYAEHLNRNGVVK